MNPNERTVKALRHELCQLGIAPPPSDDMVAAWIFRASPNQALAGERPRPEPTTNGELLDEWLAAARAIRAGNRAAYVVVPRSWTQCSGSGVVTLSHQNPTGEPS